MTLTNLGFITGLSGLLTVIIGWSLGVLLLKSGFKQESHILKFTGLMYLTLVNAWLGIATHFLFNILGLPLPSEEIVISLAYPSIGVALIFWTYVCFYVFRPELAKWAALFYTLLAIVYITTILIDPIAASNSVRYLESLTAEGIPDSSLTGLAQYILIFYIVTGALIQIPVYFSVGLLGYREDDPRLMSQGVLVGLGVTFFLMGATLDAILRVDIVTLTISRIATLMGLLLMFVGYMSLDISTRFFRNFITAKKVKT